MKTKAFRFVQAAALLFAMGEAWAFPNEIVTSDIAGSIDDDSKHGIKYNIWYHPYGTVSGVGGPVHEACAACGNSEAGYKMRIYSKQDPTQEKFDKPLLITQGFDPDQGSTKQFQFDGFRDMLSYVFDENSLQTVVPDQNLLKELYEDNYDIVLVIFYNSNMDIPTQAKNLEQAYLWLKSKSSTDNLTEPAIIGPSMGGLVTRYMLQEAGKKTNSGGVDSRLFISWDSPNRGAQIPMSLQTAVRYVKGYSGDASVLNTSIASAAAGQMLTSQLHGRADESETHVVADYEASGSLHGDFMNAINNTASRAAIRNVKSRDGFTPIRTIAIANGSRNGSAAGRGLPAPFKYATRASSALDLDLYTAGANYQQRILYANSADQWQWIYNFKEPAFLENMAGGNRNSYSQLASALSKAGYSVTMDSRFVGHCFIPTVSALGYTGSPNTNSWWQATSGASMFDETYAPASNQEHVQITKENKKWILDALSAYGPRANAIVPVVRPLLL